MFKKNGFIVINLVFILSLLACTSPTYLDAEDAIAKSIDSTQDLLTPAHVIVTDEAFIDTKPVFHEYNPRWTEREVSVTSDGTVSFRQLMAVLFKDSTKVKVIYQDGVEDPIIDGVNINGKIIDVLKQIKKSVNYHYIIEDNDLVWLPSETRIFQLGVLPGSVTYSMGGATTTSTSGFGATVGSEVKGGDVTYKNSGSNSTWKKLNETLKTLVSKTGTFILNEDASTVTVIDRPNNMQTITDYVEKFNNYNLQQVGIKIAVIEVELSEEYKRGIDWDIVRKSLANGSLNTTTSLVMNNNIVPNPLGTLNGDTGGGTLSWILSDPDSNYGDGTNAAIQYIEEQGNLAILSEPRFTVLNNQVAEIKITRDEGYVKERKDVVTNNVAQVSITPGSIKTGFSLYIVPTIFDSEVLLQITTSLSRRVALAGFDTAVSAGNTTTALQLPIISDRRFTQRSVVPNNATLVLTGFKEVQNATGDISPFKVDLAGGQGATNKTTEIVILITPVIIRG